MKFRVLFAVMVLLASSLLVPVGAVPLLSPANNDFANATEPTLPFTETIDPEYADLELFEPMPSCSDLENSVWYRYTATSNDVFRAEADPAKGSVVMALYTGSDFSDLVELACDTYSRINGGVGVVQTRLEAGKTYFLQVGNPAYGFQGTFEITILSPSAGLGHDDFANAQPITSWPWSSQVDSTWATTESDEPRPSCVFSGHEVWRTVWYSFTTQGAAVWSLGSGPSPNYYRFATLYEGSSLGDLTELGCHADGGTPNVQLRLAPQTTYFLQLGVAASNAHTSPLLDFTAETGQPIDNDILADAQALGPLPTTVAGDTTWATDGDEPRPSCVPRP